MTKEMRVRSSLCGVVERTGGEENDAGNIDLELVLYNLLEKSAVDMEWLNSVNGSIGSGFFGPVLVLDIPVPLEFL